MSFPVRRSQGRDYMRLVATVLQSSELICTIDRGVWSSHKALTIAEHCGF